MSTLNSLIKARLAKRLSEDEGGKGVDKVDTFFCV